MRLRTLFPVLAALVLAAPSAAVAAFPHTVMPGESLSSVAALDGLSVAQLAAANGISPDSQLIAGSTLLIPPQTAAGVSAPVTSSASPVTSSASPVTSSASPVPPAAAEEASETAEPVNSARMGGGSYLVQPGDTLSGIAARAGISVAQLAADNGLDPNGILYAGSVLRMSGSREMVSTTLSTTPAQASAETQPVGAAAQGSSGGPPYPTPERVSATEVGQIASANGVPPSLAQAIGWQESGFNNDLISTADARGVMQILPGTWEWIQRTLTAGSPLAPASAADNVRGGVLLLRSLLNSTAGNPALAAAGYYQGLPSVQRYGLYPSTQQYVNDVMALRQRFGGG